MKRNLVIGLLITLALVVSGFTYAFWAAGIAADDLEDTQSITVGTGETVSSTVNLTAAVNSQGADALVPAGFAAAGKVESLTLTFTIDWDSTGADASGLVSTLTASFDSAANPSTTDVTSLFNVSFNNAGSYSITSDGSSVTVIATVTMDEPANQAEYDLVAGLAIDLTFTFTVAAVS